MVEYNLPFAKAYLSKKDRNFAIDAVNNGWGKNSSNYINLFENSFKKYLKCKFSIATSSCTGALHLALKTLNIKDGDEVIVPDITWIASAAAITYVNAVPVFAKVNEETWCIDEGSITKMISKRTKAIIAVHLYGNIANIKKLKKIAKKFNLFLIEDAAESLGSEIDGKKTGTLGDIGVFSFHGTKTFTTGEGGMLVTNNKNIYNKALVQSNHGRKANRHNNWWMDEIGLKYKMSNVQAAIGYGQIIRADEIVNRKREIFFNYKKLLKNYNFNMNYENRNQKNSFWLPVIIYDKLSEKKRDSIILKANNKGIGLRPFFYSLRRFKMFKKNKFLNYNNNFYKKGICLPSYHELKFVEQKIIIKELIKLFSIYYKEFK